MGKEASIPYEQTHEALQASEERFKRLTENMLDMVAETSLLGICTYASSSFKAVLGYDPKDMVGQSLFEFVHADDLDSVLEIVRKALATGSTARFDYRYRHADGHYVWLESVGNPVFDEKGQITGAVLCTRDITERKQMEEQLRISESKYSSLVEGATDLIFQIDEKDEIISINSAAARLLGRTAEEVLGKSLFEVYPKEIATMFSENVREVLKTGKSRIIDEKIVFGGDELWINTRLEPVLNDRGVVYAVIGVARDITERKKAEEEMQKLASVVRYSSELIGLATLDGKITFLNEAGAKMLGIDPEEAQQVHIMQVIPDHLQEEMKTELLPTLMMGGAWEGDLQYRNLKTNQLKDVHAILFTVKDPATGAPLYLANVSLDITERKRMEEALQESEGRYRALFDSASDAIFIHDMGGRFLEVNKVACERLGYSREELLQLTPEDIDSPEYAATARGRIEELRKVGHSLCEIVQVRRDGTMIPTELNSRIIEFQGKPAVVSIARDISERKRAEEASSRLAAIVESSDDAIIGKTLDGVITSWNQGAEKLYGYSAEEAKGKPVSILTPPSHLDELTQMLEKARRGEQVQHYETERMRKDGKIIDVSLTVSPIRDSSGRIVGASTIARDITERKEVERMKDQFVSMVSHELRTPLTSIRASIGLLASGATGTVPEKGQRMLEIAVTNTDRLVRLINDILDSERLASGKTPMEKKLCSAVRLVTQAADVMKPMAEKAGVSIVVESQNAGLWADPDRIVQALTNLINNAIKFSRTGGKVWVTTERKEDHVVFKVRDEGRGIPHDKLGLLFERFQQVDASDAREMGGTGLGLSISKSIVEQHNGRIWVESTVGKGSTFFFRLPLLRDAEVTPQPEPTISEMIVEEALTQRRRKVLIIEDDADLANIIAAMFQRHYIQPHIALTGERGVALSKQMHPDVIVLDLILPDIDGSVVVEDLRKDNVLRSVPLVVYTVRELDKQQRENLKLGETLFFTKSRILPEQFEEKVIQFIERIFEGRGKTDVDKENPDSR